MKYANINIDMDTLYEDLNIHVSAAERDKLIKLSYDKVLPNVLDFFENKKIKTTFVVIGRDAKLVPKHIKKISDQGHEIANHSFNHIRNFTGLKPKEIHSEISKCNEAIHKITGVKCNGFRAPCYNVNSDVLKIISKNNLTYDMSIVNSFLYQMLKKSYKMTMKNKEYVTDTQRMSVPKRPYKEHGIVAFPISNSKIFSLPFITGLHLNMGKRLSKTITKDYMNNPFLNINAHLMEFMDVRDFQKINMKNFVVAPKLVKMDYRKEYFYKLVDRLKKKNFKILRMDDIISSPDLIKTF
ncbi:MAG: polysaccharide deacetylase family protein [Nanoarchaeota archaeon]